MNIGPEEKKAFNGNNSSDNKKKETRDRIL
jgi:hypothetical protein